MICSAKRNRLTPQLFEKLLLQRVNNKASQYITKHQSFGLAF